MTRMLLREYSPLCKDGMCDVNILTEAERKLKNDGFMILAGTLSQAESRNGNQRIYRYETLFREMENYQKLIKENRSLGTLDHEDSEVVNLAKVSHLILRTWWERNTLKGTLKILKTPMGAIAEGLVNSGVQLGISSRALGNLSENGVVDDTLSIICFDLVSSPSSQNAFLHLQESQRLYDPKKVFTKSDRINRALNDVLRKGG